MWLFMMMKFMASRWSPLTQCYSRHYITASSSSSSSWLQRTYSTNNSNSNSSRILDYTPYLSAVSRRRRPSAIRAIAPLVKLPGMISLGGGNPNPATFPFSSMSVTLKSGETLSISEKDMAVALQYGPTPGIDDLVSLFKHMVLEEHKPPYHHDEQHYDLCVSTGGQDALTKAFEMLLNPNGASSMLIEEPTYSGALAALKPMYYNLVPVCTDGYGLKPTALRGILDGWNGSKPKPHVLYTIPNGSNPTGASMTSKRKKEVYEICRFHNVIILEDDPYYYLQFAKSRVPSFFSMDIDGRVLRFDSLSKIVSSGLRCGYTTGPPALIHQLCLHTQATTLHSSSISQMVVLSLLRHWQSSGSFETHVQEVRQLYLKRKEAFLAAAKRHLSDLATWTEPAAGMFVWFRLNDVADTSKLIMSGAAKKQVLLVPGAAFISDDSAPCPYVRASFSLASEENFDTALSRFATLICEAKDTI